MRIEQRMTSAPAVVDPATTIEACRELMRSHKIHHLPVVRDGALVGLLTATTAYGPQDRNAAAGEVAMRAPVRAYPDELLYDVLGRCTASMQDACVITNRQDQVVGILTERDVVRMAAELVAPHLTVQDAATTTVEQVPPTLRVSEGLDRMRQNMFRHLVVAEGAQLRGVLSLHEVMLARDPRAPLAALLPEASQVAVRWDQPLTEAAQAMMRADVDAVAVLDSASAAVEGLLTVTDLLRALRASPRLAAES